MLAATSTENVYLFPGSPTGPSTTAAQSFAVSSSWQRDCPMDMVGDVNGDGYDDLLVGNYYFEHGTSSGGKVVIYRVRGQDKNDACFIEEWIDWIG